MLVTKDRPPGFSHREHLDGERKVGEKAPLTSHPLLCVRMAATDFLRLETMARLRSLLSRQAFFFPRGGWTFEHTVVRRANPVRRREFV